MASTVWKGYLTFGLVSIPVRLYAAASTKSVRFNQLYRHPPPEKGTYFDSPQSVASPSSGGERRDNIRPISGMSSAVSSSPVPSASQLSRVTQALRPAGEEST